MGVEAQVVASKEVDHVVEVPWPGALSECPQLFSEYLLKRVAPNGRRKGGVWVWVSDLAEYRRPYDLLVGCQVKLDARRTWCRARPDVIDASLGSQLARPEPNGGLL